VVEPHDTVTLLDGACFCISSPTGAVAPGGAQGLFFLDTRFVSELRLVVNDHEPEALATIGDDPFTATFVGRCPPPPGQPDSTLLAVRRRYVGVGLRDDVEITNLAAEATYCRVELRVDADFADLNDVRTGSAPTPVDVTRTPVGGGVELAVVRAARRRGVRVVCHPGATVRGDALVLESIVAPGGTWAICVEVAPIVDGEQLEPRYVCGQSVDRAAPTERLERWRRGVPAVETDHRGLAAVMARSAEDLGALRVFDPEVPERAVVAAGAPWSMSLVGRDALLTSWMALIVDPDLALGVLETLARFQGSDVDPRTEEEPGRILHELRFGFGSTLALDRRRVSYGSADATPLFVMLLGELRRWGLAPELVERLLPHADRALRWIEEFGDRDGDGYVEYQRATDRGRLHQGWRDAPSAVCFADGTPARPPVALCEVQGYVYAAYLARSHFAREAGDDEGAERWRSKAVALRERFNRDFWVDDRGWLALGLDGEKRCIDALTSSMGHCLWTGILDEDKAAVVAERLLSPELFSGWGVRTLATSMAAYNPMSYQAGSVWPHDNALCVAGLVRYGFVDEAHRLTLGLLDAAVAFGHRLPELFAGFSREQFARPVAYPNACSPQAWSAASPLLLLRSLLRLDPWIPAGKLWLAPALPEALGRVRIENVPLLGGRITVEVDGAAVKVEGLPASVDVVSEARPPLAAL
jgi:glycogen debranching enzyme